MSNFAIKAYKIESVEPHPNADRLDIIKLEGMGFILISERGLRKVGEVVLYCPQDSVMPEYLLKPGYWDEARGKGMLSGSLGNRVKPKRLRGVFSEGIMLALEPKDNGNFWQGKWTIPDAEGNGYSDLTITANLNNLDFDYAEALRITKYEHKIPVGMQCKAVGVFQDLTLKYDFDSIKADPTQFYGYEVKEIYKTLPPDENGVGRVVKAKERIVLYDKPEEVWISEKIHGSLFMIGYCKPEFANEKFYNDRVYFSSKGLGGRGIILDHTDEGNLWVRALKSVDFFEKLSLLGSGLELLEGIGHGTPKYPGFSSENSSLLVLGEVYGSGVQDLEYGSSNNELHVRIHGASLVRAHQDFIFFEYDDLWELSVSLGVPMAPVEYVGPFDPEILKKLTDGNETLSGKNTHMKEGVVVQSTKNHFNPHTNRWERNVAKSVSEAYHERKPAKGKELTEFQ